MEFITEEVKTSLGLTDEQIGGLKPLYENHIADKQKAWDAKANDNAENILSGAASKIEEVTKVKRDQGEKVADYIVRSSSAYNSSLSEELKTAKAAYEQKLKDFKGDEATKAELDAAKAELDKAKQALAGFDDLKAKADKYDEASQALSGLKLSVAFRDVRPNKPEHVNEYEFKAKWSDFEKATLAKYNIEIVDGVAMAIDKDNQYKQVKLEDLVKQDTQISELLKEQKRGGHGSQQRKPVDVDGKVLDLPENPSADDISKAINAELDAKGLKPGTTERTAKFKEIYAKVTESLKK